jgi:hypothetical protein
MITGNETAYPVVEIEEGVGVAASDERGLTIRQHFAAMAMQGLFSSMNRYDFPPNLENVAYCAQLGVTAADALINELNKER